MKKVTLVGKLSLSVGKFSFKKGISVLVTDAKVLEYVQGHPDFTVEDVKQAEKPATRTAKPAKPAADADAAPTRQVKPAAAE